MSPSYSRRFEINAEEYPFESHWFERNHSAMHYVDEGHGMPVLLLHGNPTWSFLYRKVIKGLMDKCRVIAPDYPGFGLSDHPPGYGYTPQEHGEWIEALIKHLGLERFILVVQDWGGPIGLSAAVRNPQSLSGLVLCNSWCWPPMLNALIFSWIMGGPLGPFLQTRLNTFVRVMVPAGIVNKANKSQEILSAYQAPFPDEASRQGTYVFPREIRKSSAWLKSIEEKLHLLADKPIEMVWAMKDPAFGSEAYIQKWKTFFPQANVLRLENASHYLQEDCPEEIVQKALKVLDTSYAS